MGPMLRRGDMAQKTNWENTRIGTDATGKEQSTECHEARETAKGRGAVSGNRRTRRLWVQRTKRTDFLKLRINRAK